MKTSRTEDRLTQEIGWLCLRSKSDFAALAKPAGHYRGMKWNIAIGSRNGRVRKMSLKPGNGIGGMALRHGLICSANSVDNSDLLTECPVMLAEKLMSGIAFPLIGKKVGTTRGILLLGRRNSQAYAEQDIQLVTSLLPRFIEMIDDGEL